MEFNTSPSTVLHIDLNSCFATIEQQANPLLRGKPVAVAAYTTPNGCILAASVEAKLTYGIKTGMRVKDGRALCPKLIILPSDPWKYRNVHLKLRQLLAVYTNDISPKSIDEFVLNLAGYPALGRGIHAVAGEIKIRIKKEIGEWLRVSIGIAPNRYLAKIGAGLHKPDGLDEINKDTYVSVYKKLGLTDLTGIKVRNAARLSSFGIHTVWDFYKADIPTLKAAFSSINGYYWYLRLRGREIDSVEFGRRSYGNSYALPRPFSTPAELSPLLSKLVTKMSSRFRRAGLAAQGIHLAISYRDGSFWHKGVGFEEILFAPKDIYRKAFWLLSKAPTKKPVRELAVSAFNLKPYAAMQLELFDNIPKKRDLVDAIDDVNERWGEFIITSARMFNAQKDIPDRIAFGGVKELEEFAFRGSLSSG